jgi:glutamate racemase
MKIGVFDSGIGGLSVTHAMRASLPEHEIIFRNDSQHVPYGTKPAAEVLGYVLPILQSLVDDGCKLIVVACNTVSTTLMQQLRQQITVPLIAMEPMVRSAAELTKTKIIAVCATPATLASDRYAWLKATYASGLQVIEPDCSAWSSMIERNAVDHTAIARQIGDVLNRGADVIVLGCTHYHWIEEDVVRLTLGRARVIQPEQPVIRELQRQIAAFTMG